MVMRVAGMRSPAPTTMTGSATYLTMQLPKRATAWCPFVGIAAAVEELIVVVAVVGSR